MDAITNPFAKLRASLPPLAPEPAPIDISGMDKGPVPSFPSTPHPKVSLAPFNVKTATPDELAAYPLTSKLRTDISQDLRPWGFKGDPQAGLAPNHPGFLGKLGHALSVATGGPDRRQFQEMGLQKSLQSLLNDESKNELQGAQTGEAKERTGLMPEQLEIQKETAENKGKEKPVYKEYSGPGNTRQWFEVGQQPEGWQAYEKPLAAAAAPHDAFHEWLSDPGKYQDFMRQMAALKPSEKGAYGSLGPAFAAYHMLSTAYKDNPALLPLIAPMVAKIMGNPEDAAKFAEVPIGQPENEEGAPIGTAMPGAPTGATRTRGQFAGEVLPTMHEASQEIDKLGAKLGPFAGRYSELLTGKIGKFGPEFSGLQTDLHNIATAWGRLHGNSVESMKGFMDDLNASKDPANLKEKLVHYEHQANLYKAGGEGRPDKLNQAGPKIGMVEDGYRFKGGNPAEQKNWEKVK